MKKYALLMACAAIIAACQPQKENEKPEDPKPVPEKEEEVTEIPEAGGTVTEGDLLVDIP